MQTVNILALQPMSSETSWNGDPIGYQVWYVKVDSRRTGPVSDDSYHVIGVTYPQTRIVLSNLASYSLFEVKVATVNSIGRGPFSSPTDVFVGDASK